MVTSSQHTPAAGGGVNVLVAGMKANTTYHMRATVANDDGTTQTDVDHAFTTGAIPAGVVPEFTVSATNGLTPQAGIELVNSLPTGAFATDLSGNIIWNYSSPDLQPNLVLYPVKLLPNGHFAFYIAPNSFSPLSAPVPAGTLNVFREVDLAGNMVRQLTIDELNASLTAAGYNLPLQVFTHDFAVLPNGHYLLMANTFKSFTGLNGDAGPTNVLGDVVIDVDQDFKPVWVWNEFDHLDVNRHPMGFPDWTHSNAIAFSPDDGNFLVSIRHQNWIVKVDYRDGAGTGNILWKLGEGGDFALKGGVDPTDWFYAQHDVNFVSTNTTGLFSIAIMDNGDDRAFPAGVTCGAAGAPQCLYSTAMVMQVDENAKTASFLFHAEPGLYSSFAGSARVLANTNVEYNLAGVGSDAYTFEVTPTVTPQTVWQMHLTGANTYRSVRMGSLYPGVQW
ncbi:MAG TPA: aryl-sulfate sulfotransferase [Acidisarcina sp.]